MTEHGHHIEERLEHMIADHPDDHSHGGLGTVPGRVRRAVRADG